MNRLSNEQIESRSIHALSDALIYNNLVKLDCNSIDKFPIWDGFILLYRSPNSERNEDLIGRIPIQIKGRYLNKNTENKYSFRVDDIRKYRYEGGAILFIVNVDEVNRNDKLLYTVLLPYDCELILSKVKSNQKNKVIELEEFPLSEDEQSSIFYNFFKERISQTSTVRAELLNLDDLEKFKDEFSDISFNIRLLGSNFKNEKDILQYILGRTFYLYANPKSEIWSPIPVGKAILESFRLNHHFPTISTGPKYKLTDVVLKEYKEKTTLSYKNILTITLYKNSGKVNFVLSSNGYLDDYLYSLEFIRHVIKNNKFCIDDFIIDGLEDDVTSLSNIEKSIDFFNRLANKLNYLGINKKLSMNTISNDNFELLQFLSDPTPSIDDYAIGNSQNFITTGRINIGNLKPSVIVFTNHDNKTYEIHSAFKDIPYIKYTFTENDKEVIFSKFAIFEPSDFACDNLDVKFILNDINNYKNSTSKEDYIVLSTKILLNIISAADSFCDYSDELLVLAYDLATQLNEIAKSPASSLNLLQIKYRTNSLNDKDIKYLNKLKSKFSSDNQVVIASNILLNNKAEADKMLDSLSDEDLKLFKKFPIFNLV